MKPLRLTAAFVLLIAAFAANVVAQSATPLAWKVDVDSQSRLVIGRDATGQVNGDLTAHGNALAWASARQPTLVSRLDGQLFDFTVTNELPATGFGFTTPFCRVYEAQSFNGCVLAYWQPSVLDNGELVMNAVAVLPSFTDSHPEFSVQPGDKFSIEITSTNVVNYYRGSGDCGSPSFTRTLVFSQSSPFPSTSSLVVEAAFEPTPDERSLAKAQTLSLSQCQPQ